MCGRILYMYSTRQLLDLLGILGVAPRVPELPASYNVAPTQTAPVARLGVDGQREVALLRWGLIPAWAKDESIGAGMINARAEGIGDKPAYRNAFAKRRCLVPVSGFYEWQARPAGGKQPYYISRADGAIMCLAGLWEKWSPPRGAPVETFTIITTNANSYIARLHERMPVILEPEEFAPWLDQRATPEALGAMLDPAADGVLTACPVSTRVNSPRNNDPMLIQPCGAEDAPPGLFA